MAELLGTNINGDLVVTGSTTINIGDNGVIKINKKINNIDTTIIEISNTGVIKLLGSNAKLEKSLKIKNADGETYSEYNGHENVTIELKTGAYNTVGASSGHIPYISSSLYKAKNSTDSSNSQIDFPVLIDKSGYLKPGTAEIGSAAYKDAGYKSGNVPINAGTLYAAVSSGNKTNTYYRYAVLIDNDGNLVQAKDNPAKMNSLIIDNLYKAKSSNDTTNIYNNYAVLIDKTGRLVPTKDNPARMNSLAVDNSITVGTLYAAVSSSNTANQYKDYAVLIDNTGKLVQAKNNTAKMSNLTVDNTLRCNIINVTNSLNLIDNGYINLNGKKIYKQYTDKNNNTEIFSYNNGILTINY